MPGATDWPSNCSLTQCQPVKQVLRVGIPEPGHAPIQQVGRRCHYALGWLALPVQLDELHLHGRKAPRCLLGEPSRHITTRA